jgi:hypothetical protein
MPIAEGKDADMPATEARAPSEMPPSGVRPSNATLAARVEAALASSARTDAALADIFRTAKFLSATIKAVRDANAGLRRELMELHASASGDSDPAALERRIDQLREILEKTHEEASRDREMLVAEHDEFIAMLITDHERELKALRTRLPSTEAKADPSPER